MPKPLKVLVVIGTRPEAIKLAPLINRLAEDDRFVVRVCHSGQHRELTEPVLQLFGIKPDHDLRLMRPGQSLDELIASALLAIGHVCDAEKPDWVVVQGDTSTALAGALAAYHRQVPVAHVEAGLRSGDNYQPWPEEGNRRMISVAATLHCAPTKAAAEALRGENIPADTVHVTGNTGIDALNQVAAKIGEQPELAGQMRAIEQRYKGKRIIGLTLHRRENHGRGAASILAAVQKLAQRPDVAFVCSCHPNPLVRAAIHEQLHGLSNAALLEPLDYPNFVRLLATAYLMLTDSGGVQEEAPSFGTPVVVLRERTERPEGVLAGTATLAGTDTEKIVQTVEQLLDDEHAYQRMARAHTSFGDGRASERICQLLATTCRGSSVGDS